jgi:hypothetical protein
MRAQKFIRAPYAVEPLIAERIEDILPRLNEAVRAVSRQDREMKTASVEKM